MSESTSTASSASMPIYHLRLIQLAPPARRFTHPPPPPPLIHDPPRLIQPPPPPLIQPPRELTHPATSSRAMNSLRPAAPMMIADQRPRLLRKARRVFNSCSVGSAFSNSRFA